MKRLAILITGFIIALNLNAQQEPANSSQDMKTIFGKSSQPQIGWFIGLDQGYTRLDDRNVWTCGLNFGMTIDHNFSFGLAGHGLYNRSELFYSDITDTAGAYLEGGYGGLLLEYTLFPKSIVHVTFPVLIGGGGASYVSGNDYPEWDEDEWDYDHAVLDNDAFFVIEPGVRAEVNLLKFMKLNAGVSYRYVDGLHLVNTSENLLNNFNATVGLKFGKF